MKILEMTLLTFSIDNNEKIIESEMCINSGEVVLLTGPNGCGKSTLIKIIMGATFDYKNLDFTGTKAYYYKDNVQHELLTSDKEMDYFRRNICYISQEDEFESESVLDCFLSSLNYLKMDNKEKYIFDFLKKTSVTSDFFSSLDEVKLRIKEKRIANKIGLNHKNLSTEEKKILRFLSLNTKQMSGGQKKIINILSNLVKHEHCNLIILDEPLNNLDFGNVRVFSNILNVIYTEHPEIAILIVTHCRSIPIINKVFEIDVLNKKIRIGKEYRCSSCFGETNEKGMYI